jgi:hypothetical protein
MKTPSLKTTLKKVIVGIFITVTRRGKNVTIKVYYSFFR